MATERSSRSTSTNTSFSQSLCFAHVIEGEIDPLKRQNCEFSLMECFRRSGIAPEEIEINAAGCFVVISADQALLLAEAVKPLNAAIRRLHPRCIRITFTRTSPDEDLPALAKLIEAMHAAGVGVTHIASDAAAVSVLIDAPDRARAENALHQMGCK
jgi:EAL domain-containing protein (putative c-di-GMP-specific phosphodiesterase class I)